MKSLTNLLRWPMNNPLPLVNFFLRNRKLFGLIQKNGEIASFVSALSTHLVNSEITKFGDVTIDNKGVISIELKPRV